MHNDDHRQLDGLITELADLCDLVGDAIRSASSAVRESDIETARRVIGDGRIAGASTACERHAQALLGRTSAGAVDLRTVLAVIRTAESLARMGELAIHIAESVGRRHPQPVLPAVLVPRFAEMGRIAADLARVTGRVIRTRNPPLTVKLAELHDDMGDLHRTLVSVIGYDDWSCGVATAIDVSLLSMFYQRFADHAVRAVEQIAFVVNRGGLPVS